MRKRDDEEDRGSNLGSIFKGLDRFINIVADMMENDKNEIDIQGNLNDPDENKKIVGKYGFNIKLGGDKIQGLDKINTLNSVMNNTSIGKILPKKIEPVTDIFNEEDKIIIVMELVGVLEEDIALDIYENILKISAEGNGNCYSKTVNLEFNPRIEGITSTFNNSIYSIVINKDY